MTVDPRFLEPREWVARTTPLLVTFGTIPVLLDPERWREWADGIAGIGRFTGAPDSRGFATWQDWAFALNNSLRR